MEIKELVEKAYQNAVDHGFWSDWNIMRLAIAESYKAEKSDLWKDAQNSLICTRLMLIVGEVSEAMEGLRENDIDNFKEELADVAIRLADLCGGLDIDLETEIKKKMEINKLRPYLHGKKF